MQLEIVSFQGISVADELICHNIWTNDHYQSWSASSRELTKKLWFKVLSNFFWPALYTRIPERIWDGLYSDSAHKLTSPCRVQTVDFQQWKKNFLTAQFPAVTPGSYFVSICIMNRSRGVCSVDIPNEIWLSLYANINVGNCALQYATHS